MARVNIGDTVPLGVAPDGTLVPFAASQPVAATGVLTSDNTNVADGDTVTIGSTVYTFKTTLAASFTSGQVKIGTDADASLTNLAAAINGSGGSVYWMRGPNTQVSSSTVSSHALTITALTAGADGNTIATTETSSHLSWGATKLSGGLAGELIISTSSGGTQRTFALTAATSSGSVAPGSKAVAFSSSSDFSGTITGATFGASQAVAVSTDGSDTIGAIAYTRAAGTLYIATLT